MHLESIAVSGFRSLEKVDCIPLGRPTILTGHNDGGKTATLDAIAFLLGAYTLRDADRTFTRQIHSDRGRDVLATDETPETATAADGDGQRVTHTWVEGTFRLSAAEQSDPGLTASVRIRRFAAQEQTPVLQAFRNVTADPDLRNLEGLKVTDLKVLATKHGLTAEKVPSNKAGWVELLQAFANEAPHIDDWVDVPLDVHQRLPRLLRFGGEQASVDAAVKTILNARYKVHVEAPRMHIRIRELETELSDLLRDDAAELCKHIMERCPDLAEVEVLPEVSFSGAFKSARLQLARTGGEAVAVDAAGAGRARRISLAVWEWANEVLQTETRSTVTDSGLADTDGDENGAQATQPDVVILYDEPDTHLDYSHQRRVMQLIRQQCDLPQIRMMIATHSMNLIDGVDIASIVHLTLRDNRTVMERLADESGHNETDRHLAHIAAALGLRNSVLLHERLFVGVEGPTEQQSIPVLFRLATGMPLQSAGIALWACNNNEGALMFAKFLASHDRRVSVLIDADSLKNQKIFGDDKFKKYGLDPDRDRLLIGGEDRELEYLFTDEQWAAVAQAKWPRTDSCPWTPDMIAKKRSAKKFSEELLLEFKTSSLEGPQTKPEMVYELVATFRTAEEVPEELHQHFSALIELANPVDS
ncbi:hypothetical protein Aph02nite_76640 [Actinoplanes philippinensis]|uniref:OLD protein-like TOPRIM domain-containing protein n=1 Tax=Actinoplanes philippinensis TaxID=35752 RepID=A0A1I2HEQ8_9ACTN|nr:TOPRIM nucleotidyl transferase/hydrolase domain-containing protein [Actinoplanes philippinensis]GIE81714.1 hypothetical protein Aph02nite_76640 [Actinoplanes philippinensis]SFF28152.1 hypothetical protein SAMN05421541_108105 [Actinoplanes philippinensis]